MARPQSPLAVRTKERGRTIAAPLADSSVGWRHVDSCGKGQQRIELNADKAYQIPLGQSPKIGTRYECYVSCDSCWSSQQFSETATYLVCSSMRRMSQGHTSCLVLHACLVLPHTCLVLPQGHTYLGYSSMRRMSHLLTLPHLPPRSFNLSVLPIVT